MRKFLFSLALLFAAVPAFAQFTPPPPQTIQSGVGFWATGKTSFVSASSTSAQTTLSVVASAVASQVQIYNSTTGIAFVQFSPVAGITASVGASNTSTSDYPVAPGAVVVVTVPAGTLYAAVVLSTSTGAVYLTPGAGL